MKVKLHSLKASKVDEGWDWTCGTRLGTQRRGQLITSVCYLRCGLYWRQAEDFHCLSEVLTNFLSPHSPLLEYKLILLFSSSYKFIGSLMGLCLSVPTRLLDLKVGDNCILFLCCSSPWSPSFLVLIHCLGKSYLDFHTANSLRTEICLISPYVYA